MIFETILANVELIAAFVFYLLAVITYHWLSPWTTSRTGRHLMFVLFSTMVSLGLIIVSIFILPLDRFILVDVLYGLFTLSGLGILFAIIMEQTKVRRDT